MRRTPAATCVRCSPKDDRTPMRLAASLAALLLATQIPFEQTLADLSSGDANVRLRAVSLLKDAAFPEAALPMAKLVGDPQDAIQLEAIAAELNIFLAEKVVTKKRVGFVIEKRASIVAEAAFSGGPLATGGVRVPPDVVTALLAAVRDDNPRVGLEALYAFGTISPMLSGAERQQLLRVAGPDIAAQLGSQDPAMRYGAARVMGRLFARRPQDPPIEETVGDGVIVALNDRDSAVKAAAMQALGAMRYNRAVTALTELFTYYGKGNDAAAALDALAHIASPSSVPLLTEQLSSKAAALRGIAVEGFARLGDPARLPEIQLALKAERAEGVLLAQAFAATLLTNAPIDPIAEALVRSRQREQAKPYLIEIAPGRAGLFTRQVQDPDPRLRLDIVDV